MSDRVAIIGGTTVGRDHFPVGVFGFWAVPDLSGGVPSSASYLWFLPTIDACYAFYVIRRWYFGAEISYTLGFPGPTQTSHTLSVNFEFEWNVYADPDLSTYYRPTRESDLVLPRFSYTTPWEDRPDGGNQIEDDPTLYPNFSIFNYNSNNGHDASDIPLTFQFSLFNTNPRWRDDSLVIELQFSVTDGDSTAQATNSFAPNVVGSLDVNLGSGLYSSKSVDITASGIRGPNHLAFTSVNAVISPNPVSHANPRFWAYAAKDGSPIWGTTFGEQLQSPFN